MKYRELLWENYSQVKSQEVVLESINVRIGELLIESECGMDVQDALLEAMSIQSRETTYHIRETIAKIHSFITEFIRRARSFVSRIIKYIEAQLDKAYVNDHSSGKNKGFLKMTIKDYHGYDIEALGNYIGTAETVLRNHAKNFDGVFNEAERMVADIGSGKSSDDFNDMLSNFSNEIEADRKAMLKDLGFDLNIGEFGSKYWDRFDAKFSRHYPALNRCPVADALREYRIDRYDSKSKLIDYVRGMERHVNKLDNFDRAISEATKEVEKLDTRLTEALNRAVASYHGKVDDEYVKRQNTTTLRALDVIRRDMQNYISDLNGMTHFLIQTVHKAITEACTVASCKSHIVFESAQ